MKTVLRSFLLITLLCPLFVYGQNDSAAKVTKINKVVIDPGHGGRHPGCVYKKFLEKDITLSIGLKLGDLIKRNFPDVQVIYTRTTDKYVDLDERGRIANKAGADLFISIHINSSESSSAAGTSTYVMGLDKSNKNLEVAMQENDVVIYEEDYSTKYEGYKPGDPTSYIIFSLMQSAYLEQSMQLAELVQKHFKQDLPMKDLGARQGPFLVLWDTSMPAILTEVGFMSNTKDREYITTNKGQNAAARSLFNAFSEYKSRAEGRANVLLLKEKITKPANGQTVATQGGAEAKQETSTPAAKPATATTEMTVKPATAASATTSAEKSATTTSTASSKPATTAAATGKPATTATQAKPETATTKPAETTAASATTTAKPAQTPASGIKFYIQLASLSKPKAKNSADFKSYKGKVTEIKVSNGTYKYLVGGYAGFDEAARKLPEVKREFKDAFIVAFDGTTPVKLDEAKRKAK